MRSPKLLQAACFVIAIPFFCTLAQAQLVPGTGTRLAKVGDDFEDENWKWVPNGAKASREQDGAVRRPTGYSANRRWFESPKRGMPDVIERVATPANGLPGSKGALRLQPSDGAGRLHHVLFIAHWCTERFAQSQLHCPCLAAAL